MPPVRGRPAAIASVNRLTRELAAVGFARPLEHQVARGVVDGYAQMHVAALGGCFLGCLDRPQRAAKPIPPSDDGEPMPFSTHCSVSAAR